MTGVQTCALPIWTVKTEYGYAYDGDYKLTFWDDSADSLSLIHSYSGSSNVNFTAEQTISGLEKGSYKLTGYIQGEAAGDENAEVFFYAVINGKTYKADAELNGYVNWYAAELGLSLIHI